MRKNIHLSIIAGLFAAMLITSCEDGPCVNGVGPVVEREIELEDIHSIWADGSFDFIVEQSDEQSIIARGQQNIIDDLSRRVINGEWQLDLEDRCYRDYDLEIFISIPDLNELTLNGSNEVVIDSFSGLDDVTLRTTGSGNFYQEGLMELSGELSINSSGSAEVLMNCKAESVDVNISGSGDIKLTGSTDREVIDITGSGNVMAFGLATRDCEVDISGSGNIEVNVFDNLDVDISGSGNVFYRGNPQISVRISGSGEVFNAN